MFGLACDSQTYLFWSPLLFFYLETEVETRERISDFGV